MPPDQDLEYESLEYEDDVVGRWRVTQFTQLGFDEEQTWLLATSGADLSLARTLVAAGCPLHLVVRIVT
jgi:hypothetical protein